MPPPTLHRRQLLAGLAAGALAAGPLRSLAAGAPPALGAGIRLIANENPYGPSPAALAAMRTAASRGAYYPGPERGQLIGRIAAANDLAEEAVVVSSGSSEALNAACLAWGRAGRIVAPAVTFDIQLRYAERLGVSVQRVPLADDLQIDLEAMAAAVDDGVSLVYLCNPNNPTGLALPREQLDAFVDRVASRAVVLIDEAYNELAADPAAQSMLHRVQAGDNVIVTRTFSKIHGLAGLRIGYAMAPPALAETLRQHVMSFPSSVAYAGALASHDDRAFLQHSRRMVAEGRALVQETLGRNRVRYLPTEANFIYADIGRDADAFQAAMKAEGVLIRGIYGPYRTWSRISMGRLEDLERFAEIFDRVYNARAA
jgi:histidinol-phosphate aminotransferase